MTAAFFDYATNAPIFLMSIPHINRTEGDIELVTSIVNLRAISNEPEVTFQISVIWLGMDVDLQTIFEETKGPWYVYGVGIDQLERYEWDTEW